jgi:site-specific recombinase XerD
VILQTMFTGLMDAGYLVANPFRALMKSFDLPVAKVDIRRSFTTAEWEFVLRNLAALPSSPETHRLRCILELLVTSGVRLDELARARYEDLRVEALPDHPPTWILKVTGKRNKTRDIPLQDSIVVLITQHAKEFLNTDKQLVDAGELPLIRTLHASVPQWHQSSTGDIEVSSVSEKPGSPLSASGIYAVLKRFFTKISFSCNKHGFDQARFLKASTHWMRHTFVRQALVDGVPIEVVSELAGHASIDTTSIYSTQELARKIDAVKMMRRRRVET